MADQIFTFWEGPKPAYIDLCLKTWKFPYTVLNYDNLSKYTDFDAHKADKFTLPQIADCVRVHVLKDSGGCWLDADTIMLGNELPAVAILGNDATRDNTIGFLRADAVPDMFIQWAAYQDSVLQQSNPPHHWDVMGNAFTNPYLKEHSEIYIGRLDKYHAECSLVESLSSNKDRYKVFYFEKHRHLTDIDNASMLMLHNSWTPGWYKKLSTHEVFAQSCTMSNILREVLCNI